MLANKHVAIIGGSNMRGLYKDIVWLINDDSIIPKEVLGDKSEARFPDFDGQKWAKSRNRISARLRRKFNDDNRDHLIGNEGTIHALLDLVCYTVSPKKKLLTRHWLVK